MPAQPLRVLGIDVSDWQGNISDANWATLKRATNQQVSGIYGDGRSFVVIRSSRGGTTGYYDENDSSNSKGNNTLSQRYDDPYYIQNITHATSAGLLAGTYHFARPDIIATTTNSGGIANSGSDEADHMLQMASPWMRPGYLPPVLDLESGQSQRSSAQLTSFSIDFSDRIYSRMGIRPMIYVNGNYASYLQASIVSAFPNLWSARWPNQADPNSIDVQNGNPKDSYSAIYGPWDDPPNPTNPWKFWQYASTAHVNAIGNGASSCDVDVAQGGLEFLKDLLVPALWASNGSGLWSALSNWNSGQAPVAPVQGPGQKPRIGDLTLPTPRLPDVNDTVILDRSNIAVTVTLDSGAYSIRKLYMRETLNLTGGSLTINYVPSWDSTPISAQFSGPVTLSGGASLSVHTLQVDATRTLTLKGGTLTFNTINLMPDNSTPAKIILAGDMTFNVLTNGTATIANGGGLGSPGSIDLGGTNCAFNVAGGVSLLIGVPTANGAFTKSGLGTIRLGTNNTYSGQTVIAAGTLALDNGGSVGNTACIIVSNAATFDVAGKATGFTLGAGQILAGNGLIVGPVTASGTVSPGASSGTLTFSNNLTLAGITVMEVSRNGLVLANDSIVCAGKLTYGGTLVVTNVGQDSFNDGDAFRLFDAATNAAAFTITNLPPLTAGFAWDTSGLGTGVLKIVYVGGGEPAFQSIVPSGSDMILSGSNGVAGRPYYLLTSTNLALPLTNWTRLATNAYGPGGSFTNNVPVVPSEDARFYRLQSP
jgi:autotransporter-associated beta strand protein